MRIVHEIRGRCQVCGDGDPYYPSTSEQAAGKLVADNFKIDLLISGPPGLASPPDGIYIEGSAKDVRDALLRAVAVIDASGTSLIVEGKLTPDWNQGDLTITRKK